VACWLICFSLYRAVIFEMACACACVVQVEIIPELYATPWFITLFARKLSLEHVYLLWDMYLIEGTNIHTEQAHTCHQIFGAHLRKKMIAISVCVCT
jgi:hypothetical protein